MAFYNHRKEQLLGSQIKWKSTTHESNFNPVKRYYAVIKQGDKSFFSEYEGKYRSEAEAIFTEESRLMGGKVEVIGVLK
jgi:hypothetical protein